MRSESISRTQSATSSVLANANNMIFASLSSLPKVLSPCVCVSVSLCLCPHVCESYHRVYVSFMCTPPLSLCVYISFVTFAY